MRRLIFTILASLGIASSLALFSGQATSNFGSAYFPAAVAITGGTEAGVTITNSPISGSTGSFTTLVASTSVIGPTYSTTTNCAANSVSPAACGSAASGAFVIPTTTATYTVNTSAVTSHSRIQLTSITFAADLPSSPTCVSPLITTPWSISAISTGVSFTVALTSTTGQTCFYYTITD